MLLGSKKKSKYDFRLSKKYKNAFRGDKVTLDNVKGVSLNRLTKMGIGCNLFNLIIHENVFDLFLCKIVIYFHWFFELKRFESALSPYQVAVGENVEYIRHNLKTSEKLLGYWYGMLLLKISDCRQGFSNCKSLSLDFFKEEVIMWEQIFNFLGVFVWVAFGHKDHSKISTELSRLFMNGRVHVSKNKTKTFTNADIQQDIKYTTEILKGCRSTVIRSFLPDKASEAKKRGKKHLGGLGLFEEIEPEEKFRSLMKDFVTLPDDLNYGIIGQPLKMYDSTFLYPMSNRLESKITTTPSDQRSQRTYLTPEESLNYYLLTSNMVANLAKSVENIIE